MTRRLGAALVAVALAAAAETAEAQIAVDTDDGWRFTFAGNVSAFYLFEHESPAGEVATPGTVVGIGRQGSSIRSGYLPAFAVFDAKRIEGRTRLGVHFGFAPQVQTTGGHDDSTGTGARIDMRQVYLTVGGGWGQVLAGREVGIFGRQSLLSDMTLFGVGATGGSFGNPAGTTLGRSGFGYIYPGFNAQLTYSTPQTLPFQVTVGAFDPSVNNDFTELILPRFEMEITSDVRGGLLWAGAMVQRQHDPAISASATAWGVTGGARGQVGHFAVLGSGYTGAGIGTTLLFADGRADAGGIARLRRSSGYLAQIVWSPPEGALTLGVSWGRSSLRSRSGETFFRTRNESITAGAYFRPTPSLRVVGEWTVARSDDADPGTHRNRSVAVASGLMLFF